VTSPFGYRQRSEEYPTSTKAIISLPFKTQRNLTSRQSDIEWLLPTGMFCIYDFACPSTVRAGGAEQTAIAYFGVAA